VCDPVTASTIGSSALGAFGSAQAASRANAIARRDYEYKLKVRERRWMRERSLYQTGKVQYERNIDESNIAAQRAYTQSQISLNRIRSQALLDHQADFKEMLKAEGAIEAKVARNNVGGKSVARLMAMNLQRMGMTNAMRSRALTESHYRYKTSSENIQRKLQSDQNQMFSKVAIQPIPDLEPVKPVYQNVNQTLFMGLAGAALDGVGAYHGTAAQDWRNTNIPKPTKSQPTNQPNYWNQTAGMNPIYPDLLGPSFQGYYS